MEFYSGQPDILAASVRDYCTGVLKKKIGIWQAQTQTPWDYRSSKWVVAAQKAPEGCPIKGNISKTGKIYHSPWSPWYSKTKVSIEKGERWFCDETEAVAAGWRAPIWGN